MEIIGTQTSFFTNFGSTLSFILCFLFPEGPCTTATYIFTAPTCTTTIITLHPCALNAEFHTQKSLIKFPYFADTTERGASG
jgi:hypothetical protein